MLFFNVSYEHVHVCALETVKRVIIVCSVLVARTRMVQPGNDIVVPPETIDTTVNTEKLVYVKFNDYEFYPLYMVYYRRTPEDLCQSRYFNRNKQKPRICAPSARKPDAQRSEQQPERQRPLTQQLRQYHDAENWSRLQAREQSSQTERKFMLQQQRERKYEQERQKRTQNRGNCLIL